MLVKLLKNSLSTYQETFSCLNKVFVPEFITFSLYGKLLKMCPKIADESPLRGAKPRWSPER